MVLFHELLGLGANWQVTELVYLKGGRGEVRIVIEDTNALVESLNCKEDGSSVWPACPTCVGCGLSKRNALMNAGKASTNGSAIAMARLIPSMGPLYSYKLPV